MLRSTCLALRAVGNMGCLATATPELEKSIDVSTSRVVVQRTVILSRNPTASPEPQSYIDERTAAVFKQTTPKIRVCKYLKYRRSLYRSISEFGLYTDV